MERFQSVGFFKVCCRAFSGFFQNLYSGSTAQQLALLTTVSDALSGVGDISDRTSDTPQGLEYTIQCQLHENKPYLICCCAINIESSVCVSLFCNVTGIECSENTGKKLRPLEQQMAFVANFLLRGIPTYFTNCFSGSFMCSNGDKGDHVVPTIYQGVEQRSLSQSFAFTWSQNIFHYTLIACYVYQRKTFWNVLFWQFDLNILYKWFLRILKSFLPNCSSNSC